MTTRLQRWEIEDQGGNWSSYRTLVPVDMTPERRRGLTWDDPGEWVRADDVAPLEDRIAELEAEVERLRRERDELSARVEHAERQEDKLYARLRYYQRVLCLPGGRMRALDAGVETPEIAPVKVGDLINQRDRLATSLWALKQSARAYMGYHSEKFYPGAGEQVGGLWPAIRRAEGVLAELEGK